MRHDSDFDRLYDLGDGSGRFLRRSGALNAVFSQSDYVRRRGRTTATVPAGTIYYIGVPPPQEGSPGPRYTARLGAAKRLLGTPLSNDVYINPATRLAGDTPIPLVTESADPLSALERQREQMLSRVAGLPPAKRRTDVMTHEPYRRGRLHELTRQAVIELIENEPKPEPTPEALLEELESALDR